MSERRTRFVFDRVQSGDEEAAREVFERYMNRLVALARSRLSDKLQQKFDADDIVQSAFRSFFRRAQDRQFAIRRSGELWALLASITRHKLLKKAEHYRQQKRNVEQDQQLPAEAASAAVFSGEPTPQEAVALTDEVEFLMRELEPMQRRMLEMRLQGQTIPEIAEAVQRSERTVRRFLSGFRDQLEQRLSALRDDA